MVVDAKRAVLRFEPLDTVALLIIGAAGTVTDLQPGLAEEINAPFHRSRIIPFGGY
jgi:hypothetical protein